MTTVTSQYVEEGADADAVITVADEKRCLEESTTGENSFGA